MAAVLIGSTGQGKSSLGNFLLDPDNIERGGKYFAVASSGLPTTKNAQEASNLVSNSSFDDMAPEKPFELKLIDTPDLNEGDVEDLQNMMDVLEKLQEVRTVRTCILVVKFLSIVDNHTIKYYSKLFHSLFERNTIIVMTNFQTDPRSIALRERQGVDVDAYIANVRKEIVKASRINFEPSVFFIDSMPMGETEEAESKLHRSEILSYLRGLQEVSVHDIKLIKPRAIMAEDQKECMKCLGEIDGYAKRLAEIDKSLDQALRKTKEKETEITEIEIKLSNLQTELDDKDSEQEIILRTYQVAISWKPFQVKDFEIQVKGDFTRTDKWGTFKNYNEDKHKNLITGSIQVKNIFRGISAGVTVYSTKKLLYKDQIPVIKRNIANSERLLAAVKTEAQDHKKKYTQFEEEITLLTKFIERKRKDLIRLKSNKMTIGQANDSIQCLKISQMTIEQLNNLTGQRRLKNSQITIGQAHLPCLLSHH